MRRSSVLRDVPPLPDDVLVSAQGVSRAAPAPDPEPPRWLKRILPKSGIAGQLGPIADSGVGEDDEEEDEEEEDADVGGRGFALQEVSFEVRAGEGVAIAGADSAATLGLLRILTGALPPTTGRVFIRGRVAALVKQDLVKYFATASGHKALFIVCRFLHWPRSLLQARMDEIMKFARLEELEEIRKIDPRAHRNKSTMRLLFSAALHMDANVYVVDEGIPSDDEFGARCFDLLEQRQSEGAGVVQRSQKRVEEVARLCREVLWIEEGALKFRGRPLDVAIEAERAYKEDLHPLSVPIFASLADSRELVEVGGDGGTVEIDLEILRKHLHLGLTLQLTDCNGKSIGLDHPDRFHCEGAGLYRLCISIPGGLLPDAGYDARLLADIGAFGADPMPPRELLAFEIVSGSNGDVEEPGTQDQVEWHVSRASA